jgi:hypothetical protein
MKISQKEQRQWLEFVRLELQTPWGKYDAEYRTLLVQLYDLLQNPDALHTELEELTRTIASVLSDAMDRTPLRLDPWEKD